MTIPDERQNFLLLTAPKERGLPAWAKQQEVVPKDPITASWNHSGQLMCSKWGEVS